MTIIYQIVNEQLEQSNGAKWPSFVKNGKVWYSLNSLLAHLKRRKYPATVLVLRMEFDMKVLASQHAFVGASSVSVPTNINVRTAPIKDVLEDRIFHANKKKSGLSNELVGAAAGDMVLCQIKNLDGKFSTGGQSPSFNSRGKVWDSVQAVKRHISLLRHSSLTRAYDDCVVVVHIVSKDGSSCTSVTKVLALAKFF